MSRKRTPQYQHDAPKKWTGPVVRRRPREYQQKSEVLLVKCPTCREYLVEGSRTAGRCLSCNVPLPHS